MTDNPVSAGDLGPPVNAARDWVADASFELSDQLKAQAQELTADGSARHFLADELHARAETMVTLIMARLDLDSAEAELASAREVATNARAALEPIQADHEHAVSEHEKLGDPSAIADLDARIAARQRRLALEEEVNDNLHPQFQRQSDVVKAADATVTALERDNLPTFRAAVAQAERILANPPFGNLVELAAVAPIAARNYRERMGLLMLAIEPGKIRTNEGKYLIPLSLLKASGVTDLIRDQLVQELRLKLDPATWAQIRDLVNPPEPTFTPPGPQFETAGDVRGQLHHGNRADQLPDYTSPEGVAIRRAAARQPATSNQVVTRGGQVANWGNKPFGEFGT